MMKTIKFTLRVLPLFLLLALFGTSSANAQTDNKISLSGTWQYNSTTGNSYAKNKSGWGANLELGYKVAPALELGVFMNWQTNNKYIPRQTYINGTSATNMDQSRSLFQLPFGIQANYIFVQNSMVEPYIGLKFGPNYARYRTYSNIYLFEDHSWGVFLSPEIGVTVYPIKAAPMIGIKLAGYYSYSNNKYKEYNMDNINNLGFRVGIKLRF